MKNNSILHTTMYGTKALLVWTRTFKLILVGPLDVIVNFLEDVP